MKMKLYYYKRQIACLLLVVAVIASVNLYMRSSGKPYLSIIRTNENMQIKRNSQSGIVSEGDISAYYGTYIIDFAMLEKAETMKLFISVIKQFDSLLSEVSKSSSVSVKGTISFGKRLWNMMIKDNSKLSGVGSDLFNFPGYGKAPATQADFYIHIHSMMHSASFDCGQRLVSMFPVNLLKIQDERMGFIWRDSRDLTGFIDGTENPHGDNNLISAALNPDGSSYVIVQRFVHNLSKWSTLSNSDQENVIGRKKHNSDPIEPPPKHSHVSHADIKFEGEPVKIVRQSLPYGMPGGEKGLWFTAYCHSMKHHNEIQSSVYGLRSNGEDSLMSYITPVTGGYYFTPSLIHIAEL